MRLSIYSVSGLGLTSDLRPIALIGRFRIYINQIDEKSEHFLSEQTNPPVLSHWSYGQAWQPIQAPDGGRETRLQCGRAFEYSVRDPD